MKRLSVLLFPLVVPLLVCGGAHAQSKAASSAQGGELYSIEKRDLMGSHELTASLGVLPMDAFARGMTLHGSYTYHFSHLIAWEIVGGMWSFNFGTGLDQELKDNFLVQATEVPELRWVVNSNFVLKPLYGKFALTNDKLFSAEMFFVLGYAMGGYTASYPSGLDIGRRRPAHVPGQLLLAAPRHPGLHVLSRLQQHEQQSPRRPGAQRHLRLQ